MKRLKYIPIPDQLKNRKKEILGEIKNNTMHDCVYNNILPWDEQARKYFSSHNLNMNIFKRCLHGVKEDFEKELPSYLKDYQREDILKALLMTNVFNINKPGYGKTLETITWMKIVLKNVESPKVLILCPKSVIETWKYQLNKYWPEWGMFDKSYFVITNYEQLYNAKRLEVCSKINWDVIVLDESHYIKSFRSKINHIVFELKSTYKHCLTGTPVKNRPQDIAAQLKWLDQESITNFTDFQFAFCDLVHNGFGLQPEGLTKNKQMIDNLHKLLSMYCVGGEEHNAKDYPEPIYNKIRLTMDSKVKALYNETVGTYDREMKQRVIDTEYLLSKGIKVSNPIEAVIRRQQLASNPQLFDSKLKNVKFDWILEWLKNTDEKVVIFSKYAQTIHALEDFLKANKCSFEVVKREQNSSQRQLSIKKWQQSKQVLLGTFGVLGTGVDGLQEKCHYVIFIDREWTASDNEQAEKRIWRLGQTKQPIIYILQCIGSIDVRIEHIQLDKGHDAQELLDIVRDEDE